MQVMETRSGKACVSRLSSDGEVVFQKEVSTWYCIAVAPDRSNGEAWVLERQHSVGKGGNRLLRFGADGTQIRSIPIERPFGLACDADGTAWVVSSGRGVVRVKPDGEKLPMLDIPAKAVAISPKTGHIWITTEEKVLRVSPTGEVLASATFGRKSSQSWIAAF